MKYDESYSFTCDLVLSCDRNITRREPDLRNEKCVVFTLGINMVSPNCPGFLAISSNVFFTLLKICKQILLKIF